MLYNVSNRDALRAWLVKTLEPICDAEPVALATYVLALLEHDAPEQELRQEFIKQLEEFLENGAASFVDTLFATLRSKSYIPYSTSDTAQASATSTAGDTGIPIPLETLLNSTGAERGTKRSLDEDDSDLKRGAPKGPRVSSDGRFARFAANSYGVQEGGNWQGGAVNGYNSADGMGPANGYNGRGQHPRFPTNPSGWVDLPRGVCRDYHIKGYCARGHMCKFSHDDAAFAPEQMMFSPGMGGPMGINGGIPLAGMPVYTGGMPFCMDAQTGVAYDPHEAQLDMRQPFIPNTGIPRMAAGSSLHPHSMDGGATHDIQSVNATSRELTPQVDRDSPPSTTSPHMEPASNVQLESASKASSTGTRPVRGGNSHFRGSRGGRGTFTGDHQSFRSEHQARDGKTLVVEKIPEENLTLEAVNSWFKRFGTVTNVAVDTHAAKALVSFSTHDEAHAAWKTQEAVFSNRFVKIFWHRPLEGQGAVGTRMLQASAPLVSHMTKSEATAAPATVNTAQPSVSKIVTHTRPSSTLTPSSSKSTLAAKQKLLEKKIAEQRELMGRLATASADEKKDILAQLRKLDEPASSSITIKPTPSSHSPGSVSQITKSNGLGNKERKAKELLDMELEMHAAKSGSDEAPVSKENVESEETTESLQEKLAKLRAEAEALGIADASGETPMYSSGYHGYRGRGRGRSRPFLRGTLRGGPPRASMKLDNRPKSLLVKGIDAKNSDIVKALQSWYEIGGQLVNLSISEDDGVILQFRSRSAAEAALVKGSSIPNAGTVTLSWHQHVVPANKAPIPFPSDTSNSAPDRPLSPPRHEEIVEDPGWGNGEDGMGTF